MEITLEKIGKRFNREWIFRHITYTLESGKSYAIIGSNGSGKSTLLQLIAGKLMPTEGSINFKHNNKEIAVDKIFRHLTLASPYLDLYEELTLNEAIEFHFGFKSLWPGMEIKDIPYKIGLPHNEGKYLYEFSSGMKQRLKLGLAIFSNTEILLLDEPLSNLDKDGFRWYSEAMEQYRNNRLTVVCSNTNQREYSFCDQSILVENFK